MLRHRSAPAPLHPCLTLAPLLLPQAHRRLVSCYKRLRSDDAAPGSAAAYRITVRQLEALVRLSEALARLYGRDEVRASDVTEVGAAGDCCSCLLPCFLLAVVLQLWIGAAVVCIRTPCWFKTPHMCHIATQQHTAPCCAPSHHAELLLALLLLLQAFRLVKNSIINVELPGVVVEEEAFEDMEEIERIVSGALCCAVLCVAPLGCSCVVLPEEQGWCGRGGGIQGRQSVGMLCGNAPALWVATMCAGRAALSLGVGEAGSGKSVF